MRLWAVAEGSDAGDKAMWVIFEVVQAAVPGITWAAGATWKEWHPRAPQGEHLQDFEADDLEAMLEADEGYTEAWWAEQAELARLSSLAAGDQTGGLLEVDEVVADIKVLGNWMRVKAGQPEGREYEYPRMPEDNTEEMLQKASVFIPGGICEPGMEAKWRAAGADEQVLQWIREGGYRVQVDPAGVGHFLKNGKLATEHNAALCVLVLELLLLS